MLDVENVNKRLSAYKSREDQFGQDINIT